MKDDLDRETRELYLEIFENRAAIMEYDGKLMRSRAEIAAQMEADTWLDIRVAAMHGREEK